jgi:hypothetical protein
VFNDFIDLSAKMMDRADMRVVNPFRGTRERFEEYARRMPNLSGILADYGRGPQLSYPEADYTVGGDRVPVFRILTCNGGEGDVVADTIREIRAVTPADVRPAFLHVFAINWWNTPTGLTQVMAGLGDGYVACTPNQFLDLWRQSQGR